MPAAAITSCAACPCGRAAGVASGGRCPLIDRRVGAGWTLHLEGEAGQTVWFVKRGAVVLSRAGADGVERPHAVRGPGAFVGLAALVTGRHAETARTSEPSILCAATRDRFDRWLGPPDTPARMALEQVLRAAGEDGARAAAGGGPAVQRVARWLLGPHDAPAVPRHVLASLLGMTPETLSRALARLRDDGAIALTRRTVTVTDAARLEAATGAPGGRR